MIREHDENLIIVSTVEEYGMRHHMDSKDVWNLFRKYNINDLLRSQYDVLHTLDMSESVDFAEDILEREAV